MSNIPDNVYTNTLEKSDFSKHDYKYVIELCQKLINNETIYTTNGELTLSDFNKEKLKAFKAKLDQKTSGITRDEFEKCFKQYQENKLIWNTIYKYQVKTSGAIRSSSTNYVQEIAVLLYLDYMVNVKKLKDDESIADLHLTKDDFPNVHANNNYIKNTLIWLSGRKGDSWDKSCRGSAQIIIENMRDNIKKFQFYHQSDTTINSLITHGSKLFDKANPTMKRTAKDRWNPSDIFLVRGTNKSSSDGVISKACSINNLKELNDIVGVTDNESILKRDKTIIGISLKKDVASMIGSRPLSSIYDEFKVEFSGDLDPEFDIDETKYSKYDKDDVEGNNKFNTKLIELIQKIHKRDFSNIITVDGEKFDTNEAKVKSFLEHKFRTMRAERTANFNKVFGTSLNWLASFRTKTALINFIHGAVQSSLSRMATSCPYWVVYGTKCAFVQNKIGDKFELDNINIPLNGDSQLVFRCRFVYADTSECLVCQIRCKKENGKVSITIKHA